MKLQKECRGLHKECRGLHEECNGLHRGCGGYSGITRRRDIANLMTV